MGHAVNVWLEADLTKYTTHRPGALCWMGLPGQSDGLGSATYVCVRPWNEWVLLFGYDPAKGEPDLSDEGLIARARTTIGDPDVAIRIKAVSKWSVNQMVATTYNKGRVLIAGNAAHRHPPANGLGANTCVHDAFNLAWKLALVIKGQAGTGLLDTYTQERQPTGHQVVERAIKSVAAKLPMTQALGLTPAQDAAAGWANLDELHSDTPVGRERRENLRKAVALQNYQFNCHGVELGQIYRSAAVIPDGTLLPQPTRDAELYHHPHAWLRRGNQQVSTLDLVGHGRFTLLTGVGGGAWRGAARSVAQALGVEIDVVSIGGPNCDAHDVYGRWHGLAEISDDGALLVRPDRHVAWRHPHAATDATAQLLGVMRSVLALALPLPFRLNQGINMTQLQLFGTSRSRALRALWGMEEVGIAFDHVPMGFGPESKMADYLAVNPSGRIPALIDGELRLFESMAINLHLCKHYGGSLYRPMRMTSHAPGSGACGP